MRPNYILHIGPARVNLGILMIHPDGHHNHELSVQIEKELSASEEPSSTLASFPPWRIQSYCSLMLEELLPEDSVIKLAEDEIIRKVRLFYSVGYQSGFSKSGGYGKIRRMQKAIDDFFNIITTEEQQNLVHKCRLVGRSIAVSYFSY